jgi:hypothetical protein
VSIHVHFSSFIQGAEPREDISAPFVINIFLITITCVFHNSGLGEVTVDCKHSQLVYFVYKSNTAQLI